MKSNTRHALKQKFKFLEKVDWDGGGIWATGSMASTVGVSERVIQNYIRYQEKEDAGQAELEFQRL